MYYTTTTTTITTKVISAINYFYSSFETFRCTHLLLFHSTKALRPLRGVLVKRLQRP
jgi:hypothetical protein